MNKTEKNTKQKKENQRQVTKKRKSSLHDLSLPLVRLLTFLSYFLGIIAPAYFILWFSTTRNLRAAIPFFGAQKILALASIIISFIGAMVVYFNTRKHRPKKEQAKKLLDEKIIPDNITDDHRWRRYHIMIKLYIIIGVFFWLAVYFVSAWLSALIKPLV